MVRRSEEDDFGRPFAAPRSFAIGTRVANRRPPRKVGPIAHSRHSPLSAVICAKAPISARDKLDLGQSQRHDRLICHRDHYGRLTRLLELETSPSRSINLRQTGLKR